MLANTMCLSIVPHGTVGEMSPALWSHNQLLSVTVTQEGPPPDPQLPPCALLKKLMFKMDLNAHLPKKFLPTISAKTKTVGFGDIVSEFELNS